MDMLETVEIIICSCHSDPISYILAESSAMRVPIKPASIRSHRCYEPISRCDRCDRCDSDMILVVQSSL